MTFVLILFPVLFQHSNDFEFNNPGTVVSLLPHHIDGVLILFPVPVVALLYYIVVSSASSGTVVLYRYFSFD